MISDQPMPGNPWPREMVLRVEDDPHHLLDLLWIREAYGLDVSGADLPPLLVATPERSSYEPDGAERAAWTYWWPELWEACLAHAGTDRDPTLIERLHGSELASDERARLLEQLVGPSWQDRFGDDAMTPEHAAWSQARTDEVIARMHDPRPLDEHPERRALDALIPAWRAGLTTIVVIPCRGTLARRIGDNALLVTAETRDDPARFPEALRAFG